MTFNWKITAKKMLQYVAVYGVPVLIQGFLNEFPDIAAMQINPAISGITIGTLLTGFLNWWKHRND